jgi:SNF2 family DNA or RNA helicase
MSKEMSNVNPFYSSTEEVQKLLGLKKRPYKHQLDAINIVKSAPYNQGFLIADEPGLGKTFLCLMLVKARWRHQLSLKQRNPMISTCPSFAIVPLAALEIWKKEAYDVFDESEVLLYYGGVKKKKVNPRVALIITTHGTVQSEGSDIFSEDFSSFDTIIVDEGHILHSASTQPKKRKTGQMSTSDVIMALALRSKVRYVSTGTPFRNKLKDLESIRRFIDCPNDYSLLKQHSLDQYDQQRNHQMTGVKLNQMIDIDLIDTDLKVGNVAVDLPSNDTSFSDIPSSSVTSCSSEAACNDYYDLKCWLKQHMIRRKKEDIMLDDASLLMRKKEIYNHVLDFSPYEESLMMSLRKDLNILHVSGNASSCLGIMMKMRQCCVSDLFVMADGVQWIDECYDRMMKHTHKACPFVTKEDQKRALNTLSRSTKLQRVIRDCFLFSACGNGPRVVVIVSHFVKTLRLIDILLSFKGTFDLCAPDQLKQPNVSPIRMQTLSYTGDMDGNDRERNLQLAKDAKKPTVFLVSLQSGNACVDMTFSNHFLFLDRWWTPAIEFQMQERGHRFVTKDQYEKDSQMFIHYYTMNNSVEDFQELVQTRKYEKEMEFFGDAVELEMARAKRGCLEMKNTIFVNKK